MVPTVGMTGFFSFSAPYDTILNSKQQLTVTSIRTIQELQASGEDPLNNIYIKAGESELVMSNDMTANVPIVTLKTDGDEYLYIPANKLISTAKLTGTSYSERAIIVNVGYIPTATDLAATIQIIKDDVYTTVGVTPDVIETTTSSVVSVDAVKHASLTTIRANKKTVDKSYKTKYNELLALYNAQKQLITNIETVYKVKGIGQ